MKTWKSIFVKLLSLVLVICMLFLTSCQALMLTQKAKDGISQDVQIEPFEGNSNVQFSQVDEETASYTYTERGQTIGVSHNNSTGEFFYTDEDGEFPLLITDINADGIIHWKVDKGESVIEGEVNTMESATPQALSLAIGGGMYIVSSFLLCLLKASITVVVAGVTCYLASVVGTTIRDKRTNSNYFPAYPLFNNVYVASGIGISQKTAIIRIKTGQNVWAKNSWYAKEACMKASPIGVAVWGWHGNRNVNSGYYQHYHAVRYYKSNGNYVHTGAHCWFV